MEKELTRERRYELKRKENYTQDDVKDALWFALQDMRDYSYYAPLIERYPVMLDDQMPASARNLLRKQDAPACTDSNNVYVDSEIFLKDMKEWVRRNPDTDQNTDLIDNLTALLAHEYTHVISQHSRIGREYRDKSEMEQTCHVIACEIEANRGDLVKNSKSDNCYDWEVNILYNNGVTDDEYPETKKDKFYPQIYATLLKNAKKYEQQMKQAMSLVQDLLASMDMEGAADALQKAAKNGSKNKDGSGTGMSIKMAQKGAQNENKDTSQNESQDSENNSNEMGDTSTVTALDKEGKKDEDKNESWEELTQEQIEASIQEAVKITKTVQQEQEPGNPSGYGLESPYIEYQPELTAHEMLKQDYGRWHEAEVKKELKKMKGLIRGTISKNRESTYARPTRRPIQSGGLIKKGVRYEKSYSPKVLIAMDSSGSMSSTTMKEVACAIENIFKDLGKPKVGSYICKHESNVSDVKPMFRWKEVVESYYPSGGNCFAHVVEKANELGVDVVLNIGDGQDTITRDEYSESCVSKFNNANRKWFDVLVTSKGDNRYYKEEKQYDENNGFHREGIYLGNNITKYLK